MSTISPDQPGTCGVLDEQTYCIAHGYSTIRGPAGTSSSSWKYIKL